MKQKNKVAIVILNWNGRELLEKYLPSVITHSSQEGVVLYIVDNGSTDDSISWINKNYKTQIELIAFDKNYGYAGGYNRAIELVDAEYVLLLNSDVEVTSGWLNPLIDHMETHSEVVACQPKIKSWREPDSFEYAGASGGFIDRLGYPFCRGRIFSTLEKDMGQYNTSISVFWATGAALFIRVKAFIAVGGFDERFFAHMEEIDLCWRLLARGGKIMCVPTSEVYHYGGATLSEESSRKVYLNFRNNLLMLYKNMPKKELKKVLRFRFVFDYLASLFFLFTGSISKMKSVWRARKDFYTIRKDFLSDRMENLEKMIQENITERKKYSILVEYYIKRKKKFSDLL